MQEILLLDAIERYHKGEMSSEEKAYFEDLRKNNADIDQMVVEQGMFIHQIDAYSETLQFKHHLNEVHSKLVSQGDIDDGETSTGGTIIKLWNKYKRVTGIAATIAGVTAMLISGLITYFIPTPSKPELLLLSREVEKIKHNQRVQSNQINEIKNSKVPTDETASNGGTSFLIDSKGYLVTNAHVVAGSSTILVQNNKGQQFKAILALLDTEKDLAILKIEDEDFKPFATLPYSIRKGSADLGEELFTLGYPRDEIVYNEGYLSAKTGYNGDTISCQIAVTANPGNSGGPVLNKNGEVIGILSTSQIKAEGVVFAIKSKSIFQAIEELKKDDTSYQRIHIPTTSNIRGLERTQQIKQMEDCVYMVRSFTR